MISIRIAERRLAHAVRERFLRCRLQPSRCDLRENRVEVVDEYQMPGMPRTFSADFDEEVSVRGKLPDGLLVIWEEGRRLSQQPSIPVDGSRPVGDRSSGE